MYLLYSTLIKTQVPTAGNNGIGNLPLHRNTIFQQNKDQQVPSEWRVKKRLTFI